jgi:ubiquinone/menaquinone biosynthesis C-methylase UbiE
MMVDFPQETVGELIQCDLSGGLLAAMDNSARDRALRVQCDEEALPFPANTFDLVASSLRFFFISVEKIIQPAVVF